MDFNKNQNSRSQRKNKRKEIFLTTYMYFLRVEKEFFMPLKAKYFQLNMSFQIRSQTILVLKSNS